MTDMIGLPASALSHDLTRVASEHERRPVLSYDIDARFGPRMRAYMDAYHGEDSSIADRLTDLPVKAFSLLTVDERAKAIFSAESAFDSAVTGELEKEPSILIARKIKSSMWRWGMEEATWNEIVDGYDGLRTFSIGVDGFDVTIDHTRGYNECGRGVHCRKWLDGVFAFLVFHRGVHVMTIGFSIAGGRRILVQQVQNASRTGNRWMFRLPANRLEFVIDRMMAAFPGYRIMVADGGDVAKASLRLYQTTLERTRSFQAHSREKLARGPDESEERDLAEAVEGEASARASIAHLRRERPRLAAFYRDAGRHAVGGETLKWHDIRHYAVAA